MDSDEKLITNDRVREDASKPGNYRLHRWLLDRGARLLWKQRQGDRKAEPGAITGTTRGNVIECWNVNGAVVLVLLYAAGGWDLFTACPSNNIDETLHDADERIGESGKW